jgi:hypothetical protein
MVKLAKGEMNGYNHFEMNLIFISYKERKKDRIKISSNKRNFINVTQHIPIIFVYYTLSKF